MSNYNHEEIPSPYSGTSARQYAGGSLCSIYPSHHRFDVQDNQLIPPPLPPPPLPTALPDGMDYRSSYYQESSNTIVTSSSSAKKSSNSDGVSMNTQYYNEYGSDGQYQHAYSSSARTSMYFSPPPLPNLPTATDSWAMSRKSAAVLGDELLPSTSSSTMIYKNSPYFSDAPAIPGTGSGGSSESSTMSTTVAACRPVPARSAFMCFSDAKSMEIREKMGSQTKSGHVEVVAAEWRKLPAKERAYWDKMAETEKIRFVNERDELCKVHKGPLLKKIRAKKNPLAPKRPMSAFLMYAQQKRKPIQMENPDIPNADISRLLGEMWRNASPSEKQPHLEREEVERKLYKAKMKKWKNNQKLEKAIQSSSSARRHGVYKIPMQLMENYSDESRNHDRRQDIATFAGEVEGIHSRSDPGQSLNSTDGGTDAIWYHHDPTIKNSPSHHQENHHRTDDSNHRTSECVDSFHWAMLPSLTTTTATAIPTNNAPAHNSVKVERKSPSSARIVHYSYPRPPE